MASLARGTAKATWLVGKSLLAIVLGIAVIYIVCGAFGFAAIAGDTLIGGRWGKVIGLVALGGSALMLRFLWPVFCALPSIVRELRERRRLLRKSQNLGYLIAHLCAWRANRENRKDFKAIVEAANLLGPDPWPALLESRGLPAPGHLSADDWKEMLVGLCDGYFGALPEELNAAIDAGAQLPELVRVGLETGYVTAKNVKT